MRRLAWWCLLAGCSAPSAAGPPADAAPAATPSSAETPWVRVRPAGESAFLEMPAQVVVPPDAAGVVAPPFSARLVRAHVRVGQRIARGAPVVEVVMPQLVSSAGAYLAAGTRVDAYSRRKAQLEALRAEGLARLSELADADTKLADARADQQTALATLRIAGVSPEEAQRVLGSSGAVALRSPIEGVVVELRAAIGETCDPGGRPIARIAGDTGARIEARLSHPLPAHALLTFITAAGERTAVTLISQAPVVDSRDGTRSAWFEPRGASRLSPGASGRLRVQLAAEAGAMVVPIGAVAREGGGVYVVRRKDGASEKVSVELLASSGSDALIRGPLAADDEVKSELR